MNKRTGVADGGLSIVIATWTNDEELLQMELNCVSSFRDQVDELIIVEDSKWYFPELARVADVYILHDNLGYTGNCNIGFRVARGSYIIQANSDTTLKSGNLVDLCLANMFTSPTVFEPSGGAAGKMSGAFFCVHRPILTKRGGFDDRHLTFKDADTDLFANWGSEFQSTVISTVQIDHPGGAPGITRRKAGAY